MEVCRLKIGRCSLDTGCAGTTCSATLIFSALAGIKVRLNHLYFQQQNLPSCLQVFATGGYVISS